MKIVSTKLAGDRSLIDHVWNDAMETAALHCEDWASICAVLMATATIGCGPRLNAFAPRPKSFVRRSDEVAGDSPPETIRV